VSSNTELVLRKDTLNVVCARRRISKPFLVLSVQGLEARACLAASTPFIVHNTRDHLTRNRNSYCRAPLSYINTYNLTLPINTPTQCLRFCSSAAHLVHRSQLEVVQGCATVDPTMTRSRSAKQNSSFICNLLLVSITSNEPYINVACVLEE